MNDISNEYFEWVCDLVYSKPSSKYVSYDKLLAYLHSKIFRYSLPMDSNREADGIDLRYRFAYFHGYEDIPEQLENRPCSVLEMMVALAVRCEESIMDDPDIGDRTGQWFWEMIVNLDLGAMTDARFDEDYVDEVIERFLDREYEPDGRGGLFRIRNCKEDLRDVEIWYQLCWYLDTIV